MRNINLKTAVYVIVGLSAVVATILIYISDPFQPTLLTLLKLLSKVVSVDVVLIGFFASCAWQWRIFKGWLVPFPNLNGTWKGHIRTTWIDPKTNERPAPIPAILTVHQTFFKVSCVMRTAEMTSRSVTSDFVLDKDNQVRRLFYSYDSTPIQSVRERSPQHCGTMAFDIIEKPKKLLTGDYWTARKTTGDIEMSFWKKEKLETYPVSLGDHPVSAARDHTS